MKKYDRMKDSGYPWMGKIPSHWRDINPKALFTQRKERAKEGERQLTASQQYGVLYQDEYMALTGSRVVVVQKDFDILKHVEAGDFVISMRSFQGGLEYSPVSGSISSAYVMLIPNKELVYPPFYKWLLKSSAYIRALQSTTDLVRDGQAMRYSNFSKVRLLVAPMDEQRAIASYLDDRVAQMDSIIKESKASIEEYKQWKAAIITEAVTQGIDGEVLSKESNIPWIGRIPSGWSVKKIKHLANSEDNSFVDGDWIESPFITAEGIRYLTTGNIGDGQFKRQGNGFITSETFAELNCKYAYPGDLVISRLNAPYGRSCILPDDYPEYVLAVDNVILRTNEDKRFICYVTQCPRYQSSVFDKAAGTTMKRISRTNLGNISIPIPPIETQHRIADYLDEKCNAIDILIKEKEALIQDVERYKRSLIYEAVTGKRRVV